MKLHIDPRTKLFMIFAVSIIVMLPATTTLAWVLRTGVTIIPIILLLTEKKYTTAAVFTVLYASAAALTLLFISSGSTGLLYSLLVGYCGIVVQFLPSVITAWYAIKTTKIDEFMSAMQKMHMPDGIAVSLAVVMRFFPTIKEEYGSINDAMKMRGILFGGGKVGKMLEFRIIPLLFSCVNIGEELSAAAVTRGLGAPVRRTSICELRLGAADIILFAVLTLSTVALVMIKFGVLTI